MASEIDLERYRGDTVPDSFTIKDSTGTVVNITGYSFLMTVNSDKNPADATNEIYQLTGSITDAPNGVVEFEPSAVQADQPPGTLYYDIQMTDASSKISTIVKGKLKYLQDITK